MCNFYSFYRNTNTELARNMNKIIIFPFFFFMLPTNIFLCQLFAVLFKESKHLLSWEGKVACETRELTTKGRVAEAVLHLPTNLHLVILLQGKVLGVPPSCSVQGKLPALTFVSSC